MKMCFKVKMIWKYKDDNTEMCKLKRSRFHWPLAEDEGL